jgi:hypothetical protein
MAKLPKLAQRQQYSNGHIISIGLTGNVGYISIEDNNLYPDSDSRSERRNMQYNRLMIPCMTREDLKDLRTAIDEVLKNSR